MSGEKRIVTILGATATGKTKLAAHIAYDIGAEIISADSRQVYKGMDLGTGKDLEDYEVDGTQIPYHLIDIHEPGYEYNVYEFQKDFQKVYHQIQKNEKRTIMCGGTGMYLESVLKPYDLKKVEENQSLREDIKDLDQKELIRLLESYGSVHNTSDLLDKDRLIRAIEIQDYYKLNPEAERFPHIKSQTFGIEFDRKIIRERITERLQKRLDGGIIEEVQSLLKSGVTADQLKFYGLEYKFVTQYILKEISFNELFRKLNTAIHQFAKRQITWFKRMEKNGINIHWIDGKLELFEKIDQIKTVLSNH